MNFEKWLKSKLKLKSAKRLTDDELAIHLVSRMEQDGWEVYSKEEANSRHKRNSELIDRARA